MIKKLGVILSLAGIAGLLGGCERTVSYGVDVQPVLDQHCGKCHAPGLEGYETSEFSVQDYAALMKGTKFGPVIQPGNSFESVLVMLVEGRADPSIKMPHQDEPPLSDEQIGTIKLWIDQGASNN